MFCESSVTGNGNVFWAGVFPNSIASDILRKLSKTFDSTQENIQSNGSLAW